MKTTISDRLCAALRIVPEDLRREFEAYLTSQAAPRAAREYSTEMFDADMQEHSKKFRRVTAWVQALRGLIASEASAERVFRRLKLTVTKTAMTMLSATAEARVKIGILSEHYLDAKRAKQNAEILDGPQPQQPVEQQPNHAEDAAASEEALALAKDRRERFHRACGFILKAAVERIAEKQLIVGNAPRPHPRATEKCNVCSKSLASHKATLEGTAAKENGNDFVRCHICTQWFSSYCIGINYENISSNAEVFKGWSCESCRKRGVMPQFW
jgi:hypothetical protein